MRAPAPAPSLECPRSPRSDPQRPCRTPSTARRTSPREGPRSGARSPKPCACRRVRGRYRKHKSGNNPSSLDWERRCGSTRGRRRYRHIGALCRRFPLKTLLFWGTVVAIPQMVPLLFIHPVTAALIVAVPIGLMGGVATAAYLDLLIRSCPRGLQGTMLMMSAALYAIVQGLGNVLGTNLYDHFGGFTVCVIAITIVYALILPVLLLVPKRLIDTADGQTPKVAFTED